MLRWRKLPTGWAATDKWTKTSYFILIREDGVELDIHVEGVEDSYRRQFATVGAAKTFVTKYFS
jgi:hypothetical protein